MCVLHPCQYSVQSSAQGGGSETAVAMRLSPITRAPQRHTTADSSCRIRFCFCVLPISPFSQHFFFRTPIDRLRRDTDTSCRTPQEPAGAVTECAVAQGEQDLGGWGVYFRS